MVKILKDFRVTAAGIEKCPPYSITTGQPAPVANTAIETATVITVDVIRPVSSTLATALNRFIYLANLLGTSVSSRLIPQIQLIFLREIFVPSLVLQNLDLGRFYSSRYGRGSCFLFDICTYNSFGIIGLLFSSKMLKSKSQ